MILNSDFERLQYNSKPMCSGCSTIQNLFPDSLFDPPMIFYLSQRAEARDFGEGNSQALIPFAIREGVMLSQEHDEDGFSGRNGGRALVLACKNNENLVKFVDASYLRWLGVEDPGMREEIGARCARKYVSLFDMQEDDTRCMVCAPMPTHVAWVTFLVHTCAH